MRALLFLMSVACGGSPPDPVSEEAREVRHEEDAPAEAPAEEEEGGEEALKPPEAPPTPTVSAPPVIPTRDLDTDQAIEQQQEVVEDLKYELAGLEWFLDDQHAHKTLCPEMEWTQPAIEVYREHPHSYLPDGCVGDQAEEEAFEDIVGEEPREELPARR